MVHALFTLLMQVAIGWRTGRWGLGGAIAAAFFVGREITQAEYRWIAAFGEGRRINMPLWGGLDPAAWTLKSALDAGLPVMVALGVFLIATRIGSARLRDEGPRR